MKKDEAFMTDGWEEVRMNVPVGKYRVVLVDMFDLTAMIVNDFDTEDEAVKFAQELGPMLDSNESLIVYDDEGELIYDTGWDSEESDGENDIEFHIGGEDVAVHISEGHEFAVISFFLDSGGKFEDLLFEVFKTKDEALNYFEKVKNDHKDAYKIVVADVKGSILEEFRGE